MPTQPSFSSPIKKLLVYSITVAIFTILPAPRTMASTTWTITVDVTKSATSGSDLPSYTVQSSPPGAPNCANATSPPLALGDLYICAGDTVQWTPTTTGKQGWLTIHQNKGFLPAGSSQWFRAREKKYASVTTDPKDYGITYEYCVSVHDAKGRPVKLYTHDPKIIIGGTPLMVLIEDLQLGCARLPAAIDNDAIESEDRKKQLRDQAARACEQIKKLNDLLPSGPSR